MSDIDRRKGYDPVEILIYDRKKELLYEEMSLVAIDKVKQTLVAAGNDAISYTKDTEDTILVISPLKMGVVADFTLTQMMFKSMLQRYSVWKAFRKPKIAVSIPADCTEVERKAFQDVFYQAGAKEVCLSEVSLQEMKLHLPSAYDIFIEIVQNKEKQVSKEIWKEVCRDQISAGRYRLKSIQSQELDLWIIMENETDCVELLFHKVQAIRILEKKALPENLFAEEELKKFRKEAFQHVVYQIEHGEFFHFVMDNENKRSRVWEMQCSHFLIMTEIYVIELLADKDLEIVCTREKLV